jgi:hypothetical protein
MRRFGRSLTIVQLPVVYDEVPSNDYQVKATPHVMYEITIPEDLFDARSLLIIDYKRSLKAVILFNEMHDAFFVGHYILSL